MHKVLSSFPTRERERERKREREKEKREREMDRYLMIPKVRFISLMY
jgi:hypothetical protein